MSNRLLLLVLMIVGVLAVPAAHGAVTAEQLIDTPVVVDEGATLDDADRALLEESVRDLEHPDKAFPTRYVIVAAAPGTESMHEMARRLRAGIADRAGIDQIDAVVVLAPRAIGISADAFQAEIDDALVRERSVLMEHGAQGAINVVNHLQRADAAAALQLGEQAPEEKGVALWVWIAGGVVVALGVAAMVLARRASARGERAAVEQQGGASGADPDTDADAAPEDDPAGS